MGSIGRRIGALEGLVGPPEEQDPEGEARRALLRAILNEHARLKASRAGGLRGGVPIVPEDIPGKVLGPYYTTGEEVGLAVRRVVERELSEDLDEREREDLVEGWTGGMRSLYERIAGATCGTG